MKTKLVKLFNGRVIGRGRLHDREHFYVGATSIADVVRLVKAAGDYVCNPREVNIYWSKGCWGNAMDGISPERGVWWQESWEHHVRRLVGANGQKIRLDN